MPWLFGPMADGRTRPAQPKHRDSLSPQDDLAMTTDPKSSPAAPLTASTPHQSMKIFTYPKIIFIIPTLIASLICGIGMTVIRDRTNDPTKGRTPPPVQVGQSTTTVKTPGNVTTTTKLTEKDPQRIRRFSSPQNILGVIFLATFALNLLIMAIDFPRFTILLLILGIFGFGFFFLWLNVYYNLVPPLVNALEAIYVVANAGFYFMTSFILTAILAIIWVTRYLDYWEILPNEILHNHGPFSDLERYPTMNLKFDKEIPDILEYCILRSGRLVLHVGNERKSIVLDNVLWIDRKEDRLKKLMSRLEVRITSDQEAAEPI